MVVVSKKNEAMNNVIIVHQDGGSEPDNRTAHLLSFLLLKTGKAQTQNVVAFPVH